MHQWLLKKHDIRLEEMGDFQKKNQWEGQKKTKTNDLLS